MPPLAELEKVLIPKSDHHCNWNRCQFFFFSAKPSEIECISLFLFCSWILTAEQPRYELPVLLLLQTFLWPWWNGERCPWHHTYMNIAFARNWCSFTYLYTQMYWLVTYKAQSEAMPTEAICNCFKGSFLTEWFISNPHRCRPFSVFYLKECSSAWPKGKQLCWRPRKHRDS